MNESDANTFRSLLEAAESALLVAMDMLDHSMINCNACGRQKAVNHAEMYTYSEIKQTLNKITGIRMRGFKRDRGAA